MKEQLFKRCSKNPILTGRNWPYEINSVFNTGVTEVDGEIVLLTRCEGRDGLSHLTIARSKNGIDDWKIDSKPTILPEPDKYPEEEWGVEDPRVIYLEEEKKWMILYASFSVSGPAVSMAETSDFKIFKKRGLILPPENKDSALFPEKINGKWMLIHRPVSQVGGKINMWCATSPDLVNWGEHKVLMSARSGPYWDGRKIGLSTPPMKTKEGWLILYHGVKPTNYGDIYRLGFALLDLEDPTRVLRRSSSWVFGPEDPCEVYAGDIGNVVFPCGWLHNKKDDQIYLYYGAADTTIGLATAKFNDVMDYILSLPKIS